MKTAIDAHIKRIFLSAPTFVLFLFIFVFSCSI